MKKICILTTRHISYNPRVLKEADALSAKGHDVVVVTINNQVEQRRFDEELMRSRSWKLRTVNFRREQPGERSKWLYLSLKQKLFRILSRVSLRSGIAERAVERAFSGLTALAIAEKADFYLVHHAEALAAGARAARVNGARFGFDAEDFHTGMKETPGRSREEDIIAYLEGKYLPSCHYLTAASSGIAAAYKEKYGIRMPEVILNVFPFEDLPVRKADGPVRFYWYSQVIGPNRGVELLLEAAGRIGSGFTFEVHLRGRLYGAGYKNTLKELSDKYGIWDRVFFHEPILSELIVRDANQFDVGMALESPISVNRNICVTNKIFSYLMSRLLIIGTNTLGQEDIFSHFPDAVRVCRVGDADGLAAAMRSCITDRDRMLEGKMAARRAVQQAYNWELESGKLILHVEEVLNKVIE